MNPQVLNYATLNHFRIIENDNILDKTHLSDGVSVHFKKLSYADGGEESEISLFAYLFNKDGKSYLVPMQRPDGSMIDINDILPLKIKGSPPLVANSGKVYTLLDSSNYVVLKYSAVRQMSFRELVGFFDGIPHENPTHKKLFTIICLASYLENINFRISTPPGFGKDSVIDTLGLLNGDTASLVNPSLSKVERELSINRLVAFNEIVKINGAEWDLIQMVLLDCAAQKPKIKKRTRAFGGVGEEIDLTKLSVALLFNDVTEYRNQERYFDYVTDGNVTDRFPQFRFYGRINHDFSLDDNIDFGSLARESSPLFQAVIRSLVYYKGEGYKELKGYKFLLEGFPQRAHLMISRMLRYLDLYCDSQKEFDKYFKALIEAHHDYNAMVAYPSFLEEAKTKGNPKDFKTFFTKFIKLEKKFSVKLKFLDNFINDKALGVDEGLNKW